METIGNYHFRYFPWNLSQVIEKNQKKNKQKRKQTEGKRKNNKRMPRIKYCVVKSCEFFKGTTDEAIPMFRSVSQQFFLYNSKKIP